MNLPLVSVIMESTGLQIILDFQSAVCSYPFQNMEGDERGLDRWTPEDLSTPVRKALGVRAWRV